MGLFRGLLPMIGFIFIMQIFIIEVTPQNPSDEYQCQYIETLYHYTMSVNDPPYCVASQLTDNTRSRLVKVFEQYRSDLSKAKKYSNVFQINYHWICEVYAYFAQKTKWSQMEVIPKFDEQEFKRNVIRPKMIENPDFKANLGTAFRELEGYRYNVWDTDITGDQMQFMDAFTDNYTRIMNNDDPYLTVNGQKRVFPASIYFGCAIRYNHSGAVNPDHLTCVFATPFLDVQTEYKEGVMNEKSCKSAKNGSTYDPDKQLCIDKYYVNGTRDYNVPCQFFYETFHPLTSCRGIDPGMDWGLKQPPEGYLRANLRYKGKMISITYSDESNGGGSPLKLSSISMCIIVLIALMSSICS